jgi:hypothetical protein
LLFNETLSQVFAPQSERDDLPNRGSAAEAMRLTIFSPAVWTYPRRIATLMEIEKALKQLAGQHGDDLRRSTGQDSVAPYRHIFEHVQADPVVIAAKKLSAQFNFIYSAQYLFPLAPS